MNNIDNIKEEMIVQELSIDNYNSNGHEMIYKDLQSEDSVDIKHEPFEAELISDSEEINNIKEKVGEIYLFIQLATIDLN